MDPNLPQTPNPKPKRNIIIIMIIIIILTAAALITYSPNLFKKEPPQPLQTKAPTPIPAVTFKIQTPKGIITSLAQNTLTIKPEATGSADLIFRVTDTADIERLVSGTIEGPGTKLSKAALSDLKVGQKVYIIANGQNEATTVVILK